MPRDPFRSPDPGRSVPYPRVLGLIENADWSNNGLNQPKGWRRCVFEWPVDVESAPGEILDRFIVQLYYDYPPGSKNHLDITIGVLVLNGETRAKITEAGYKHDTPYIVPINWARGAILRIVEHNGGSNNDSNE